MIKISELKKLPFATLRLMALAVARDIDAGNDKRDVLEKILRAVRVAP